MFYIYVDSLKNFDPILDFKSSFSSQSFWDSKTPPKI